MKYQGEYITVEYVGDNDMDVYLGDYRVLSLVRHHDNNNDEWVVVNHLISDLGEEFTQRERAVRALVDVLESYYSSDCDNEHLAVECDPDEIDRAIGFIKRSYYVYRWTPRFSGIKRWRFDKFPAWERVSISPSGLPEVRRDQRTYEAALGKCRNVTHERNTNTGELVLQVGGIVVEDFRAAWRLVTLRSKTTSTYECRDSVWCELLHQPHAFEYDYELVGTYMYPTGTRYVKYTIRDFDVF